MAVSQDPHGLDGLITPGTRVVDEPRLTIIPTFFDTHNHFIIAARNIGKVPVDQAHRIAELVLHADQYVLPSMRLEAVHRLHGLLKKGVNSEEVGL